MTVEIDLPLVEGDDPVLVEVEVFEAGYVCVGRVGVHHQVFPDVLVELKRNNVRRTIGRGEEQAGQAAAAAGGGRMRFKVVHRSTWRTTRHQPVLLC